MQRRAVARHGIEWRGKGWAWIGTAEPWQCKEMICIGIERRGKESLWQRMAQRRQGIAAKSLGIALDRKAGKWKCTEQSCFGKAHLSEVRQCQGIVTQSDAREQ
jgi:hypothetical protein